MFLWRTRLFLAVVVLLTTALLAKDGQPTVKLSVDATEAARKIFHAHLVIPASPGALTLYYPKWIPGEHSPSGPITEVAGLKITGGGKRIEWQRDEEDPYAFHLTVPEGVESIEVSFQLLGGGNNFPVAGPS